MPALFRDVDKTSRLLHSLRDNKPLEDVCRLSTATVTVTLVAVHTVVYIAADAPMIAIGVRFGMAIRALEDGIGRRISVTGRAHAIGIAMIHREPCVIESCA
jgi:hypothetical protein